MADVLTEKDEVDEKDDELVIIEEQPDDAGEDKSLADDESPGDERGSRRQQARQNRRQRRDDAIATAKSDKTELDFLRKRNDDLERRLSAQEQRSHQGDLSNIDAHIAQSTHDAQMAERVIARAVETQNGNDVAEAMRLRDAAMQRVQQLNLYKQQSVQRPPQQQQIDAQTMGHAKAFLSENPWYDSQGRDEDSGIVLAIDAALSKDGYNPQTSEYWDELRKRASRRLPERFAKQGREPRGGPAVGSGREYAPASTRREFYISAERKQALMDAGVWDDDKLRPKYVQRYADYDKANGRA